MTYCGYFLTLIERARNYGCSFFPSCPLLVRRQLMFLLTIYLSRRSHMINWLYFQFRYTDFIINTITIANKSESMCHLLLPAILATTNISFIILNSYSCLCLSISMSISLLMSLLCHFCCYFCWCFNLGFRGRPK